MAELNIGALTDSNSYTGSVDTTNIYDLYKFNINSPGSFKFAIDGLSGNADIVLLDNSGETLYSSTNAGNAKETISADSLVAGDYTLKVLQVTGDIKYTLNLVSTSTQKSSEDTLTGAKSDDPLSSNSAAISEKRTANKDVITGDAADDNNVTAEATSETPEKPVVTTSPTALTSEPEKPATATEPAAEVTSEVPEKPVTTTSEIALTSEPEKPVAATETAAEATSETPEKPVTTTSETALTSEPEKPVAATEPAAETTSKTPEKPVTTTSETALTSEPEKPVAATETVAEATSDTPEKPVTTTSETALTSEPEKPVAVTEPAAEATSDTPEKPVATTSPTALTSEPEKPAAATETAAEATSDTPDKSVTGSPDASKPEDEKNTETNGDDTKTDNTNTSIATAETTKELEPTSEKKLISPFTSGVFTADATGRIGVDYTFDGGFFQGELAFFSLDDLDKFEPGSEAFIKEVAARSLTNSVKGHVVINDATEGARFSGVLGEANANEGVYLGVKSFAVTAGGKYGVMLVPNGSVKSVFDNPTAGGAGRPLFSMAMANPVEGFHFGQIADVTGEGNTFVMEDMRLDGGSDKDYNDIIFQVRGATAKTALLDSAIDPDKEWRTTDLGKAIIAYAKPYITPEPKPNVDAELSDLLDDLEKEVLLPSSSDKETENNQAPATNTDKDTTDATKVETTDKVDTKPTVPAVTTEEEVKDTENNSGNSTQVETSDKVDTKLSGTTSLPTADKETATDSTENLPFEKTPVPPVATEVEDKVTEAPAATIWPDTSTADTEVAATMPTEKVETKPGVLPAEIKVEEETKPEVLPAEIKVEEETKPEVLPAEIKVKEESKPGVLPAEIKVEEETKPEVLPAEIKVKEESKPGVLPAEIKVEEESKPALVTEVEKTETTKVVIATNPVELAKESQPKAEIETKETPGVVQPLAAETMPVVGTNTAVDLRNKEIVTQAETAGVNDAAPKELLPISPTVAKPTEDNSTVAVTESVKQEIAQNNNNVNADWIARLESIQQRLSNLGSPDVVEENIVDRTLIARLEAMTEKLREQTRSTPVSDNTAALISRLEEMVVQVAPQPVETVQFEFPKVAQPLVGIFNENGFSQDNPKIDYSRITLAKDRVEDDANPLVSVGEGNNADSAALAIIEQINKNAPLVVGRAPASSEEWAKSLIEYVDTAKASGQPNAIASLNLNLTQIKKDGSITPRYELTKAEKDALAYAQKYNVLVVVPAGDDSETMSALGEISLEFDNIMTVGAAKRVNDSVAVSKAYDLANTSGSGYALDILADGSSGETFNTSVAANKVAGAASQVWAANPKLSYRQVVDIIQRTATDLNKPNWDFETGSGLLNIPAAVNLAKVTPAIDTDVPIRWLDVDKKNQPLIGIIDTGFNGKNPDIDYKRIILGRDRVDNDNDPLLGGEGSEHGTHVLGIIGATQGNGIGIDGINDDAPIWLGRAIGSGKWAESLREFVDAAKASGQPKAVVNLSFDLTQTNPDGSVTTRYELTPQERQAIEYARQNGVMIVVAAGNNGGTMSALGQASQEFDNIITVGSINYNGDRADYSSFGYGLDFVARGGTPNEQVLSTIGEGVNLKQMTSDEEPPEDEMSANARTTFEEVFGPFSDGKESENDEQELESLTPEERQIYDEATKEIDQLLKDYLGAASEKIALEYVDGYYGASVDALSKFVDAFDEDLADNLIKAQELLEEAGFKTDTPTETNLDFSIPLDLGIGEMAGTSVAAAKVTGAVSQVWAANPGLSYFQVKEILKQTAVDLNKPGWDLETGSGLVNIAAAVELAKRIQPQAYQPKPIQSPLTWSGEGKVTPGERAVAVSVPTFTGRLMNAGYVTQTGWLRIRSGPGTNFAEVGLKYPGDATNFDAYENNGAWVPDPSMPGGGSSRWYKIAGTNNWMSALYIDNTPERADQERQQQDAIRRAEEDARRAEDEARRAEDEARRAEDELRRIEEEVRRQAEEEQRRRIEEELQRILEEQRRKQEQFQALVNEVATKHGELGALLGSDISNGVTVYQFAKGVLLVQPDLSHTFYEIAKNTVEEDKKLSELLLKTGIKLATVNWILKNQKNIVDNLLSYKKIADLPEPNGFVVLSPRIGDAKYVKFVKGANLIGLTFDALWTLGQAHMEPDSDKKREILVKGGFQTAGSAIGAGLGSVAGGFVGGLFGTATIPVPLFGTLSGAALGSIAGSAIGGFFGSKIGGFIGDSVNDNWPSIMAAKDAVGQAISDTGNAVSSFTSNALEAAKAKAKAAADKAKELAEKAKAAYQTATATVQQAKAAYQTFKTEVQKATTQIVQQSQQKLKEEAQKILNKVVQNPVVQQGAKVVKQVAKYAQKAGQVANNIINTGKQIVNNVINTGKQIVNQVIDTGKKAYQEVKNFVVNTYETGKKVVTETYNNAVQAVNTVTNAVSNGFNAAKSLFGW